MLLAPSAAPISVRVAMVTSFSITVQWEMVDCIHRNGDITGYSVRYGVVGSGSILIMSVSGGSVTKVTISSLMSSTVYSIEVAAVNSAGIGNYSIISVVETFYMSKHYVVILLFFMYNYFNSIHRCVPQSQWYNYFQS